MWYRAFGEITASPHSHLCNSAESAEKLRRATLLAEPFPGAVAQEISLQKVREMNALGFGQNQRGEQISRSGLLWGRECVASIFGG
jgi:hypothetical protein